MIPDGDRRQLAESGHAENEPITTALQGDQKVVTEFILCHHIELCEWITIGVKPVKDVLERDESFKPSRQLWINRADSWYVFDVFHVYGLS
jgi:hypothetical protein